MDVFVELTVMVSLCEIVWVQSVVVLVHRTVQQVLWIVTHELSDPGNKPFVAVPPLGTRCRYWTMLETILTSRHSMWTSCPSCGGWGRSWCPEEPRCWRGEGSGRRSEPGMGPAAPCGRRRSARCCEREHDPNNAAPAENQSGKENQRFLQNKHGG